MTPAILADVARQHGCRGTFRVHVENRVDSAPIVFTYAAHADDRADMIVYAIEGAARAYEAEGWRVEREGGYMLADARILGAGMPLVAFRVLGRLYPADAFPWDAVVVAAEARLCAQHAAWDRDHGRDAPVIGDAKREHALVQAQSHAASWEAERDRADDAIYEASRERARQRELEMAEAQRQHRERLLVDGPATTPADVHPPRAPQPIDAVLEDREAAALRREGDHHER